MRKRALTCGCVATVLAGLAVPAVAGEKSVPSSVLPAITVPGTTLTPVTSAASRTIIPAVAATNAIAVPIVATTALTPAVATAAIAPARSLTAPQLDLMPRTMATSQPGAVSRHDQRSALDVATTKTVTAPAQAGALSSRDAGAGTAESDNQGTRIAAVSTGTLTDASAATPGHARPTISPACR